MPDDSAPAIEPPTTEADLRFRIGVISSHLARMQSNCLEMLVDLALAMEQDRLRWLSEDLEKLEKRIDKAKAVQLAAIERALGIEEEAKDG